MFFLLFMLLVEIFSDAFECRLKPIFKSVSQLKCKFLFPTTISDVFFWWDKGHQLFVSLLAYRVYAEVCVVSRLTVYCCRGSWPFWFLSGPPELPGCHVALTRLLIRTSKESMHARFVLSCNLGTMWIKKILQNISLILLFSSNHLLLWKSLHS